MTDSRRQTDPNQTRITHRKTELPPSFRSYVFGPLGGREMLRFLVIAAVLITMAAGIGFAPQAAAAPPVKKVLIIYPRKEVFYYYLDFTNNLQQRLRQEPSLNAEYDFVSIDLVNYKEDEAYERAEAEVLRQKYRNGRPDVIVANSHSGVKFLEKYCGDIFGDTPVVAYSPNPVPIDAATLPPNYSYFYPRLEPAKNVELILALKPDTKRLYVILGRSEQERLIRARLPQELSPFAGRLDITYLDNLSLDELYECTRAIEGPAAILFIDFMVDATGTNHMPANIAPVIRAEAHVPVFSSYNSNLKRGGGLGGYVLNMDDLGREIGGQVAAVLTGSATLGKVEALSISEYQFNWQELKRWGISEDKLPPGSVILNRQPSYWETHKWQIISAALAVITVVGFQTLMILLHRRKRLAAERSARIAALESQILAERASSEEELSRQNAALTGINRLYEIGIRLDGESRLGEIAGEFLETVISLTGADMGNIQLLDADGSLKIVASQGFGPDFLEFFKSVHHDQTAYGAAMAQQQRVVVEDVTQSPIFIGTPSLDVLLAADVRAVQSTPLVSRTGLLVGVLSTHYRKPIRESELALPIINVLAGQASDIIVQVQAQQVQRESERVHAFHSAILGSVRDPLWVTDAGLRIMYWNDAAATTFGWTADEAQDQHTGELFRAQVPGSTREDAVAQLRQTGDYRGEVVCYAKDGRQIIAEASSRMVRGPDGEVVRIVNTVRDITARKRMEEELRQHRENLERLVEERTKQLQRSERHYRTLVENIPITISRMDRDYRYLYLNPASDNDYGTDRGQIIGKTWDELGFDDTQVRAWRESFEKAAVTGAAVPFEFTLPDGRTGSLCCYKAQVVPEKDELGGVESFLAISENITERKHMEAELLRLDRLNTVGEMAAAIGHEVRNPMTTVRGYLQIMQRKKEFAEHQEQFNTMIEELDRANVIISDFLSLAKNRTIEFRQGNLNNIITLLMPLLQADALRSSHEIVTDLGNIPDIRLDEKEIRQMVLNLVRNGCEAMKTGGRLTIMTYAKKDKIVLGIRNTGPEIPPAVLRKLGTPFFTTKENGTGLGLPVCYRIAERHRAKIDVRTSPEGTTFIISFPIDNVQ
jgi:PAS domain S-box-containing protein